MLFTLFPLKILTIFIYGLSLNSKNQITILKSMISDFPGIEKFEVTKEKEQIVLTPVTKVTAESLRIKLVPSHSPFVG